VGKTIMSPLGPVKVLRQNVMDGTILVETAEREEKIVKVSELSPPAPETKKDKG
jgi:hypothetical protein